jgi:hypothetical protein
MGTPPQGKYLLDTGKVQHRVNVGHGLYEWNGEVRHISHAFEIGVLLGPIRENTKEEKDVKSKKVATQESMENAVKECDAKATKAMKDFVEKAVEIASSPVIKAFVDPKENLIDLETREAIRKELLALAQTPSPAKHKTIAPILAKYFCMEINAVKEQGHGWDSILKIIRKHGLHVGREYLKSHVNANSGV